MTTCPDQISAGLLWRGEADIGKIELSDAAYGVQHIVHANKGSFQSKLREEVVQRSGVNGTATRGTMAMESQPLEQVFPRAIQRSAQLGEDRDGRGFGPALDFLEITAAQVGFFSQRLLREGGCRAQAIHILPKDLAVGLSHRCTLAGTSVARSALSRAFYCLCLNRNVIRSLPDVA